MSFQQISIIGNIGKDPETKILASGTAVCNFSVAVSDNYKDKNGERQQRTEWFNVSAFGKLGEICSKYCVKGKQVFVQGEIRTSKWEDNNGNKRESIALIAQNLKLLGSKGESSAPHQAAAPAQAPTDEHFGDVEIPF